jgi:hypothetical protein
MEMPASSRVAVIRRIASILGSDRPIPTNWGSYNITEQLLISERDSEVAAILQGQMSAETEIAVLSGELSPEAPTYVSEAEQRAAAVDAWIAANPIPDPAETARQLRERQQAGEAARQQSALVAAAALTAANRVQRGW